MRKFGRILSLILVAALLVQLFPASVFAQESTTTDPDEIDVIGLAEDSRETSEEALKNGKILFEEEELREENVKHFRLADGSYIAVQYGNPVHYEEDGQWVDYDNTLREVSTFGGSGVSHYTVTNGDSTRVFAADANADVLLTLQKGEYSLSLTPLDEPDADIPVTPIPPVEMEIMGGDMGAEEEMQADQNAVISSENMQPVQPATVLCYSGSGEVETYALSAEETSLYAQVQPDAMYSALEYAEALNGATLRYENYGSTVKESIIIDAPQDTYSYSFALETDGLTPALCEDGSVSLTATSGEIIYTVPAPYMIDANKDYSTNASYSLSGSDGAFVLTVTADEEWINAPGRVFPVLLDPTFEEETDEDSLAACFVRSGFPDTQDNNDPGLYAGYYEGNSNGMTRSYFHVNDLPDIPGGCEINSAYLKLYYYAINPSYAAASVDLGIYGLTYASGLNGESGEDLWNQWIDTLTWNKVQAGSAVHSDVLVDKVTLNGRNIEGYQTWDITTLAYDWYNSDNNKLNKGFVLKAVDESKTTARATFHGPGHTYYRPTIMIRYKNNVGLEDYYNYQQFGHGRAGTSYISDYSLQNTLVVPVIQSSSEVMPFSLELIYNSTYGGRYFTEETVLENEAEMLHTKDFSEMLMYVGWKLSAQQTVVSLTKNNKTYLIYTDADGTEHYFTDENGDGVYLDEDGLKYEMRVSGQDYTMNSKTDYEWYFANGYLAYEEDAYGNRISYNYDTAKKRLSTIKRTNVGASEETLVTIAYEHEDPGLENFPSSFTDQYGNTTSLIFATPDHQIFYLRRIIFPDGQYADYMYSNEEGKTINGLRLSRVYDAESQYGMEFSYSYNGDVRNLYEYVSSDKVYGNLIHGYKRSPSQTVYRYYGKDQLDDQSDAAKTDNIPPDDQLMFCVLDREGRTTSCYVTDSSESHVLGVSVVDYTDNEGTDKRNNSITAIASDGIQGVNLLVNGSGETGIASWSGCTSNTAVEYVYMGEKSFKLQNQTLSQFVSLEAGVDYSLSAYVKKTATAQTRLCIRQNGRILAGSEFLNYDTSGVNNGWVRISVSYTPEQSGDYEAALIANGLVYADALQFETGKAPSSYNPVDDASFEWANEFRSSGYSDSAWRKNGSTTIFTKDPNDSEPEITGYFGSDVIVLKGASDLQRVYQVIPMNQPLDSSFLFSAWAKGSADPSSVAEKTSDSDPFFGMAIRLDFSDNTTEIHYKSFDPYCRDWQYVQDIISPDKENNEQGDITITQATIAIAYDNNINTAYVDHVALRLGQAQSFAYDLEGNVDTSKLTGGGAEGAEYDEDTGDLTKYTAPNGVVFNYTSNAKHSITQEKVAGTVTDYTYDNGGYLTSTKYYADSENETAYLYTESELTTDRNHVASVTDSAGNTTTSTYVSGLPVTTTNAKGTTSTNTYYSESRRLKSTCIAGTATVNYTYDKGQLIQVERETFPYMGAPQEQAVYQSYNFDYNAWGQKTAVSVGDQTLASYEYENVSNNPTSSTTGGGKQSKLVYGNGDFISYEYDSLDRLIKTVYNDSGEYVEYTYNGEGALSKLAHHQSNGTVIASYEFERDNLGRLIRSRQVAGNNATVQRTEHIYDAIGRISQQRWAVGSENYSESYTYNDGETGNGKPNTVTTATGDQLHYEYNDLQQLQYVRAKSANGTERFYNAYSYLNVSGDRTSNRVGFFDKMGLPRRFGFKKGGGAK